MMDVTVKTLDSVDHKFSGVDGSFTILQFKEYIKDTVKIEPDHQRLIFRGKVLQDNKKLADLGVAGNVVHLVERPPPEAGASSDSSQNQQSQEHGHQHRPQNRPSSQNVFMGSFPLPVSNMSTREIQDTVRRVLDSLGEIGRNATITLHESPGGNSVDLRITLRAPEPSSVDSPARARIEQIRTVVRQANHILYHLETDDSRNGERAAADRAPEGEPHDVDSFESVVPPQCSEETHAESTEASGRAENQPGSGGSSTQNQSDADTQPASRIRHAHSPDLADAMAEVLRIHERMRPHVDRYQQLLRNERTYDEDNDEGRRTSRFFNGMQILMHNIGHVYHSLSDLNIHFCEPAPRRLYPQLVGEEHADPPEAQITLNFQSTNNQARGTTGSNEGNETGAHRQSFTIPFSQNEDNRRSQGVMQMEVTPTGIAIRATTLTSTAAPTQPTETESVTSSSADAASGAANGASVAAGTSSSTDAGANRQTPMPSLGASNFFQQMMQGMQAGAQDRGGASGSGNVRPRMGQPFPMLPAGVVAGGIRGAMPAMGAGSPRLVGIGMGRMPVNRPGLGIPQAGFPGGMHQPRGPRPGTESIGGPAIFVGPRPPADLPLYTVDPFLPCPSRHFDPRNVGRRHGGRPPAPQREDNRQPTQDASTNTEGGQQQSENELFEAALTQMLRSVVINLTNESNAGTGSLNPNESAEIERVDTLYSSRLRKCTMYNFHPLAGGGGMIAAVPIQVPVPAQMTPQAEAQAESNEAEVVEEERNEEREERGRTESAATEEDEEEEEEEEVELGAMGNMMAGIFQQMTGGRDTTLADFLRSIGEEMISGEGVVGELYRIMAEVLSFQDLLAVFSGNSSSLNRSRPRIRRFLIDNILNGNDRPSEEDFQSVARRLSEPEMIRRLAEGVRPREENLDLPGSLIRCEELAVEDALKIIFEPEESEDFGRRLFVRLRLFLRELLYLGCYACEEGERGAQTMIDRYLDTMTTHVGQNMSDWVHRMSSEYLHNAVANAELTDADIQRYLVYIQREPPSDTEALAEEKLTEKQMEDAVDGGTTPNEETAPVAEEVPEGEVMDSSLTSPSPDGTPVSMEEDDLSRTWKRALPADWVKVIEADIETQKLQLTQPPLSDAYLAGMPPKRRRVMYEKKSKVISGSNPEPSFRGLLRQAVEAVEARPITGAQTEDVITGSQMTQALSSAFTEKTNEGIRERLTRDADYKQSPSRYVNLNKLFKP